MPTSFPVWAMPATEFLVPSKNKRRGETLSVLICWALAVNSPHVIARRHRRRGNPFPKAPLCKGLIPPVSGGNVRKADKGGAGSVELAADRLTEGFKNYGRPSTSLRDASEHPWILPRPKKHATGMFFTPPVVGSASSNPNPRHKKETSVRMSLFYGKTAIN